LRERILVEVGAAEEVTTGAADEFAAAVFQAGGAGGAVDLVVVGVDGAGIQRFGRGCLRFVI
jgi:hypothetical protein